MKLKFGTKYILLLAGGLVLCALSGGAGLYFGVKQGFNLANDLDIQNTISRDLKVIRSSTQALAQNDLEYSDKQYQTDLVSALLELGALVSTPVGQHWRCTDHEQIVMGRVNDYLKRHGEVKEKILSSTSPGDQELFSQKIATALNFCPQ